MKRRALLAASLLSVLAPLIALGQKRPFRIGFLTGRSRKSAIDSGTQAGFLKGMQELGYTEGRDVVYEWRFAAGNYGELRRMAQELARLKVDVVVAEGTTATEPMRKASATIPIVMATSADPVRSGLVASLARPGGNVTGLSSLGTEATTKRVELLVAALPGLSRIALLTNPDSHTHPVALREAAAVGEKLNLRIVEARAGKAEQLEEAFALMRREQAGALIVPADAFFNSQSREVAALSAKHRIPAIFTLREHFDAGGLLVYGVDLVDQFRRSATYVDKVLKGAKPGDLPIGQPDKFWLLVNLKAAKSLGISLPQSFLMRADEVVR